MLALYLSDIHLDASTIALITSATPLFSLATQPFLGSLADRVQSPRKVALIALGMSVLFDLLFMSTHFIPLLLISSATVLSLYNAVTPLTDRIGVSSPYDFGKVRMWGSIGFAIAAQICGIIYDVIAPISIFVLFIFGTIITMYCIFMVLDPVFAEKGDSNETYDAKQAYKALFHNSRFMIFLIITIFFWGANTCNFTYISVFFKSVGGTASQVGTYQLFATMFEVPAILATDFVIKKFSYKTIMIFTCVMSIVNFVWYATLPSPSAIIAVFVFKGLSTVLFTMIQVRLMMEIVDERYVSTAFGLQAMAGRGLGAVVVQMIAGHIIDAFPTMSPYYFFLTGLIVVSLLFSFLFKEKPRTSH